jgi:hypothetical protein
MPAPKELSCARGHAGTAHLLSLTFLSNVVAYACRLTNRGSTDGHPGQPRQGRPRAVRARCDSSHQVSRTTLHQGEEHTITDTVSSRPTPSAARCAASPGRNRIFRALWRPKIRSTALSAPLGEKVDEVRKGRKGRKPPAPTRCFGFVNDLDRYRQARCGRRFALLGGAATVCCPAVSPKACTSGEFPVEHMPSLAEIAETGFRRFRPSGCCAPM